MLVTSERETTACWNEVIGERGEWGRREKDADDELEDCLCCSRSYRLPSVAARGAFAAACHCVQCRLRLATNQAYSSVHRGKRRRRKGKIRLVTYARFCSSVVCNNNDITMVCHAGCTCRLFKSSESLWT